MLPPVGRRGLPERKRQFDREYHGNRLALPHARHELPLAGRLLGFLIEAEDAVERADDLRVADVAIGHDDAFHPDRALHFGAHGFGRVLRLDLSDQPRDRNAAAGPIRPAAGASAKAWAQPGSLPGAAACTSSRARSAACARALRRRRALAGNGTDELLLCVSHGLGGDIQIFGRRLFLGRLRLQVWRLLDRHRDLFLAWQLDLSGWFGVFVATTTSTTARPGFGNPDDVLG